MARARCLLVAAAIGLITAAPAAADILIDDFEDVTDWVGLDLDTTIARSGAASGRWDDQVAQRSIRKDYAVALDASDADAVGVWIHSAVANGAWIQLSFISDRTATTTVDQYRTRIVLDWVGWRQVWVPFDQFTVIGDPVGWSAISRVLLLADGWGREPMGDSVIRLDDFRMATSFISSVDSEHGFTGDGYQYLYHVHLHNGTPGSVSLGASLALPPDSLWNPSVAPTAVALAPGATADVTVALDLANDDINPGTWLTEDPVELSIWWNATQRDLLRLRAVVPVPPRSRPRLLVDDQDLARIASWAATHAWAASRVNALLARADQWPDQHDATYGLGSWSPPPEGGQANQLYVCPVHGATLRYQGPGHNVCPIDGHNWTGWPYDQVVYLWRHQESAAAARDLGMAYRLSGNERYASEACDILVAYAEEYGSYPLHDITDGPGHTGGRVTAQVLDEALWLADMAWAYDLIADSGALTGAEQAEIERSLLVSGVDVISRADTVLTNWQSAINYALAAVGFALEDPRLAWLAVYGPFGLDYQLAEHTSDDGFWDEGSWAYHFLSLKAFSRIALAAEHAGVQLFDDPRLERMFTTPLSFSMPDLDMPRFNDGGSGDLTERRDLFEIAFRHYWNPNLSVPLFGFARLEDALYWGAEDLPAPFELNLPSTLFPDAGYAVLRGGRGPDAHYLALDFGPHGGAHGHYDKLGFVTFANGQVQAVDPGAQLYGSALHETWDKATVAHNTVVVDETSQGPATGHLLRSVLLPDVGFVRADAGDAYPGIAALTRQLALTQDYTIDVFEVRNLDSRTHDYDLVYHNNGAVSTALGLTPYAAFPTSEGYQHLSNARGAVVGSDFEVDFSSTAREIGDPYGTVYASPDAVDGSFTISSAQASSDGRSGRLGYDFSASQGYLVFESEQVAPVFEQPQGIDLDVFGDGSGHELLIRVYDASAERFTTSVGQIDWTGWRTISLTNIPSWESSLGDGVFNAPASKVGLQVVSRPAGDVTYGKVFPSSPAITASAEYTTERAATGAGSWKLAYDFSAAQGNVVYQSEEPDPVYEVPSHLRMAVYGDGSGHTLGVRVHDATDEKFRFTVGPVDWTGWRTIRVGNITEWATSGGDGDGVFDLPARRFAVQVISNPAGPATGSLFVDDVVMEFPLSGNVMVKDFEWQPTGMETGELFVDNVTLDYASFGAVRVEDFDKGSGGVAWHVLGSPDTTLVVGDGFAEELTDVVPFAMVRRVAAQTDFVSLIEPRAGDDGGVDSFHALTVAADPADRARAFQVSTPSWADWLLMVGAGAPPVSRGAGGHSCNGLLCYVRRDPGGNPVSLAMAEGSALNGPEGTLIASTVALAAFRADSDNGTVTVRGDLMDAQVTLYAPGATRVVDEDGNEQVWLRDGDYVLLRAPLVSACDRVLKDLVVSTAVVEESCWKLTAGPQLSVTSSGALTLRAGASIVLTNGVSLAPGARLTLEIDASLRD